LALNLLVPYGPFIPIFIFLRLLFSSYEPVRDGRAGRIMQPMQLELLQIGVVF